MNNIARSTLWDQIATMRENFAALEAEMATPELATNPTRLQESAREHARLSPIVDLLLEFERARDDLSQAQQVAGETSDAEMRQLAEMEVTALEEQLATLEERAKRALIPKDPNDDRNVIIEIRAGAGGDEAGLWASDLYRAYVRYAERQRWRTEVISISENPAGGFKDIVFQIAGKNAYARFKYESGVHRVQRVPETEAQERIHTSTATVAVLLEAEEVDVTIDDTDIRMDRFHSGGAGGQNVNKVETGVRLTHIPSGIVATCADERSQLKNRQKAMGVLRARLYDMERHKAESERSEARRAQVGSGDRAEKIRTYNFPDNRVTDHRAGLTTHNLHLVLDGDLDELTDAVTAAMEAKLLEEQVA